MQDWPLHEEDARKLFLGSEPLRVFWLFAVFALGFVAGRVLPALVTPGLGPASGVVGGLFAAGTTALFLWVNLRRARVSRGHGATHPG